MASAVTERSDEAAEDEPDGHRNELLLRGRLAADPEPRTLPSGDEVVTFRLIVRRDARSRAGSRTEATVDTIDCTVWRKDLRRNAGAWRGGDVVEVGGALRRRFWRGAGGVASRYDVEVLRAKRLRRAA